jgi:hypothetical protein
MPQVIFPGLFPFCVVETENSKLVGPNTYYPVGLSKEDACFLFWKAKKLHIKADYTWSDHFGDGDIHNHSYNRDKDLITIDWPAENAVPANVYGIPFLPKTETDFICFNKKNSIWWNNDYNAFTFFAYSCLLNLPFCYKFNNLYYLNLTLNFDFITSFVGAEAAGDPYQGFSNSKSPGSIQLIINNNTYDINMWYVDVSKVPNIGVYQTVTPVTGSIIVSEVWDYSQ